jgi:MSHA biogenesis protein MshN
VSLINQMLQALEQRQDRPPEASSAVRVAAPPTSGGQGRRLWLGGVLLLLLAFTAGWLMRRDAPEPAAPQMLASPAEVKPVAVAPAPTPAPIMPVVETPPPPVIQPALLPAPPKAPETPPPVPTPPVETAPPPLPIAVNPVPAKQDQPPVAPSRAVEAPAARHPAPIAPKPVPGSSPGQLKQTTPRQRAEQTYQQALAFQREGRDAEAHEALLRTLQLEPEHAAAREALAMQLTEGGETEAAETLLKEGMELNPGQPGLSMSLARLMVERGDATGALELLDKQGNAGHFGADYQALYAALLQRAGRHADAVERYRLALGANPASAPNWAGLGISLRATGKTQAARESFERALQTGGLDPALENFVRESLRELRGEGSE